VLTKTTLPHNLCTSYVTAKDNYKIDALQLTSSTAEPTAHASGFPPNVLKCRNCPIHLALSAEKEKQWLKCLCLMLRSTETLHTEVQGVYCQKSWHHSKYACYSGTSNKVLCSRPLCWPGPSIIIGLCNTASPLLQPNVALTEVTTVEVPLYHFPWNISSFCIDAVFNQNLEVN